jgi:hypothetical protein
MPFSLNFYHDQIVREGATASALPAAHRLLYVRHGRAVINDLLMSADEATYWDGPLALKGDGAWSEIWRWELAPPNAAPQLHDGAGVLSRLKMSRVITTLAMLDGTRWLFRLDQITSAAGRIADRHQHPGPGIRCLLEGAFNVQQAAESRAISVPAMHGGRPEPIRWSPGVRARWRRNFCAAWCCRWSAKAK